MTANSENPQSRTDEFSRIIAENSKLTDEQKRALQLEVLKLKEQKVNLLITGGTGVGKSSTINALFDTKRANVGVGVDPETMSIDRYEIGPLTIWDTPGLGDGSEKDKEHCRKIIEKLNEREEDGNLLIDLVMVILDGSSKDMGTAFNLINKVIIPNLGEEKEGRVLIAVNKSDMAMSGRHWNFENNCPDETLKKALEAKAASVHERIKEATDVDVTVVCYTAGYTDPDTMEREKPWNLAELLEYIIHFVPKRKRLALAESINDDPDMWEDNSWEELKGIASDLKEPFDDIGWYAEHGLPVDAAASAVKTAIGVPFAAAEAAVIIGAEIIEAPLKILGGVFSFFGL